jgi:hypothetical protein
MAASVPGAHRIQLGDALLELFPGSRYEAAQPAMARGMMRPAMPKLIKAHPRKLDRRRHDGEGEQRRVIHCEMAAGREDQIRVGQQVRCHVEERRHNACFPFHAQACQMHIDHRATGAPRHHVVRLQVLLCSEPFSCERMILAHQAYDLVLEYRRNVQLLRRLRPITDYEIEFALGQSALVTEIRADPLHNQLSKGCAATKVFDDVRYKENGEKVR